MRLLTLLAVSVVALKADSIDFSRYKVIVTKTTPGTLAAAGVMAVGQRVLAALEGVSYDRNWSIGAFLAAHPSIRSRLERLPWSGRESEPRYLSDGTVTVDCEYDLCGAVLRLLMPPTGQGVLLGRRACPLCGQEWPSNVAPPAGTRLDPYEQQPGIAYTGILIDCKGLGLKPAFFPCVVTEQGEEVIGPGFSTPEKIAATGLFCRFVDRSSALASDRLGPNPLIIRAIGVAGPNQCDPVISRQDASRVHSSKHNLELLEDCRVGLLTD